MPRQRRGLRGLAEATINTAANPFAQLARFSAHDSPSETQPVVNLPPHWHIPASGNSRELRGTNMLRRSVTDEDQEMEQAAVEVSRALTTTNAREGGKSGGKGRTETPITRQFKSFGLPNTVTQVLTSSRYFSMASTNTTFATYATRLTSEFDLEITTPSTATLPGTINVGNWLQKIPRVFSAVWPATTQPFPSVARDNLQWRTWFNKMYTYYTVLGMEYEITIQNPSNHPNSGIVIATYIDTYSLDNALQVHPAGNMEQMEQWPDVTWKVVPSVVASPIVLTTDTVNANNGAGNGLIEDSIRTIKGYYYPQKVQNNVENDEDISTWTKVGSTPDLTEALNIKLFRSAFSDTSYALANVRLKTRLIVQFKDLAPAFRWPAGQTGIVLTAPDDIRVQP
jgi:hypothetical protein